MHRWYCRECENLSITEKQQRETGKKFDHICNKYNHRVLHGNHHPEILRCIECLKDEKAKLGEIINER